MYYMVAGAAGFNFGATGALRLTETSQEKSVCITS